jgi:hypothetical protein
MKGSAMMGLFGAIKKTLFGKSHDCDYDDDDYFDPFPIEDDDDDDGYMDDPFDYCDHCGAEIYDYDDCDYCDDDD